MLKGVSVDPGRTMLPLSPQASVGRRAQSCPREPWNVAFEHECQIPVSPRPPETHSTTTGYEYHEEVMVMEIIHPRCAGIDCSKKDAKVCVRVQGHSGRARSATVSTWGATTSQVLALREHLIAQKVSCVVIESTSDYWKPFYYLLDDGLDVVLVNAASVRNLPGRKTDVSDAAWLADLGAHGLVKASFVPQLRSARCGI